MMLCLIKKYEPKAYDQIRATNQYVEKDVCSPVIVFNDSFNTKHSIYLVLSSIFMIKFILALID